MTMPVMGIREMRVAMAQQFMLMLMGMSGARWYRDFMAMLVVRVIAMVMKMLVQHRLVQVLMGVALSQMQHQTDGHQCTRHDQL